MPAPRYSIAVLSTEGWYGGTQTPRTLAGRAGNSWQYTYTGQAMDETRWMLDPAPLASGSLADAVGHLARGPAVEGIIAFGSTGLPDQPAWADFDLFLLVREWPPAVRVAFTSIAGRLTDLLFAQPAAIARIMAAQAPLDASSWDGRLARVLRSGRVLFDRTGQLAAAQHHLERLPPSAVVASEVDAYRAWFRINYNRLQTRRMLDSGDLDYQLAVDARLLYMLSETLTGYFAVRGLIWDGEKSAMRYLRAQDSTFFDQFRACLGATDRQDRFRQYERLAQHALAPLGPLWDAATTVFDSDTGADAALVQARQLWWRLLHSE